MPRAFLTVTIALGLFSACGGPTSPSPSATACNPQVTSARVALPFFSKPFQGEFPIGNLFDHDKPLVFNDSNGYLLTLCGSRESAKSSGQTDGHDGYDWRMTEGTPILAVADGLVMFGGQQSPAFCPPLMEPSSSASTVTSHAWTLRRAQWSMSVPSSGSQATPVAAGLRICISARFAAAPTERSL